MLIFLLGKCNSFDLGNHLPVILIFLIKMSSERSTAKYGIVCFIIEYLLWRSKLIETCNGLTCFLIDYLLWGSQLIETCNGPHLFTLQFLLYGREFDQWWDPQLFTKWFVSLNQQNNDEQKEKNVFPLGADNVLAFIKDMSGSRPHIFFKLCWKYFIPLLSLVSPT